MRAPALLAAPLAAAMLALGSPAQALAWDVPQRGALTFSRRTVAFDVTPPPSRLRPERPIVRADEGGHEWRYWACPAGRAPQGFEAQAFDDADWRAGRGAFGPDGEKIPSQRTKWSQVELCLRTRVDLPRKPKAILFTIDHDDGVKVWWNGRQVVASDTNGHALQYVVMGGALDAWQRGENVFAVHCVNTGGAQHCDVGVDAFVTLPPGVKTEEDLRKVAGEERDLARRLRADLFGAYRPPPLLLQGELAPDQDCVLRPPGDLRDLAWWVAVDLRQGVTGGAYTADAWRLYRLGDLQLKGKVSAVGADGFQEIDVTVKSAVEPAPRGDSTRYVDRFVKPHVLYGFDGRLKVRRRIALANGKARVAEFRTELSGKFVRGKERKDHAGDLRQVEEWAHLDVRENQDAEFRGLVRTALQKGIARLKKQLEDPRAGDLSVQKDDDPNSFHAGRLAIGLLALVKAGVAKDDPVVVRGFDELRKRTLIDTYSLGNALMALEALHAPQNEFADLVAGAIQRPRKRTPDAADKALLEKWTAQLLLNVDTRVDDAYLLRFNYTRAGRFDNSVNQYGLLGLWSAHLCGVSISPVVWEAATNHLLAVQSQPQQKVELDLVDYRTRAKLAEGGRRTAVRLTVRAAGWSYHEGRSDGETAPLWGSMTCAGIAGLAICQAALDDQPGLKRFKLQNDATAARNAGFGWLAANFDVRCHPGAIERQQQWFYYYLYGLERSALLSGIALLQDRDWYFEGAMVLVLAQERDGDWPAELHWDRSIERNAMAILFLKQGTLPVITGG